MPDSPQPGAANPTSARSHHIGHGPTDARPFLPAGGKRHPPADATYPNHTHARPARAAAPPAARAAAPRHPRDLPETRPMRERAPRAPLPPHDGALLAEVSHAPVAGEARGPRRPSADGEATHVAEEPHPEELGAELGHEALVAALRALEGLVDVSHDPPNFHFRGRPFLHFHESDDGTYADVRFGGADFEPVWASTPRERAELLARVSEHIERLERVSKSGRRHSARRRQPRARRSDPGAAG